MSETMVIACPHCATSNRIPKGRLGQGICGRCRGQLFSAKPVELTSGNFDAHAARADIPMVIDFWASWCGPCRQMAPWFEAAARDLEPQLRLGKLDTEAEGAIAGRFAIRSIPTLMLIFKGRELDRKAGAMPQSAIVQWARRALGNVRGS